MICLRKRIKGVRNRGPCQVRSQAIDPIKLIMKGFVSDIVCAQKPSKDPTTAQLLPDHAAAYIAGNSFEAG